jgi:hypothetical protein
MRVDGQEAIDDLMLEQRKCHREAAGTCRAEAMCLMLTDDQSTKLLCSAISGARVM